MEKFKRLKGKSVLITLVNIVALMLLFIGAGRFQENTKEQERILAEQSIRRAAIACYALEGFYPVDISYLQEYYGVTVDTKQFLVHYVSVASNLVPDISVIKREGGIRIAN